MRCRTLPFYEFAPGLFEIDEFDCASIFVIVGTERALLIDTGTGIGDLKWVVENRITNKPYDVVATHNHGDHIGGAGWFDEVWIHPNDMYWMDEFSSGLNFRRGYAGIIRQREGKNYAYDPERDIAPWPDNPKLLPLQDGQAFDLGDRIVTAFHCPGHSPGEMAFLDSRSRTLLIGDACNCSMYLSDINALSKEKLLQQALQGLERLYGMRDKYDNIYNSHHDFRGFGSPLAVNVLPDAITCMRQIIDGTVRFKEIEDPMGAMMGADSKSKVAYYNEVMISFIDGSFV